MDTTRIATFNTKRMTFGRTVRAQTDARFDLTFDIVSREQIETSVTGNPFVERSRPIMRLDMAARSETLHAKRRPLHPTDLPLQAYFLRRRAG